MNKNNNLFSWVCNIFGVAFTTIQTNEIFQIICLILTAVSILFSIAYNIWKWYREAKKDGKITAEEVDEVAEIIKDGSEELNKTINKGDNNNGDIN